MIVTARGVLTDERLPLSILQEEYLTLVAHDVDGYISSRYWGELSHPFILLSQCCLHRHSSGAQQLELPGEAAQILHQHEQVSFEAQIPLERGRPDAVVHWLGSLLDELAPGIRTCPQGELIAPV